MCRIPRASKRWYYDQELSVYCLRLLRRFVEMENEDVTDPAFEWEDWDEWEEVCSLIISLTWLSLVCDLFQGVRAKQKLLLSVGIVPMLVRLLISTQDQPEVYQEVLLVCIAMLIGGNVKVQRVFYKEFRRLKDSEFCKIMLDRITKSSVLRREHKKDRKGAASGSLHVHDDPNMAIGKELRLLQLLVEGHNTKMQNYLRVQNASGKSYDLISAFVEYFIVMESHVNEASIDEMEQLLETMTETIQGPCEENQRVFIGTKVLDACIRILAWSPHDLEVGMLLIEPCSVLL
jgi:hypothetical protein